MLQILTILFKDLGQLSQFLQSIFRSIIYGLAIAFLWLVLFQPQSPFNFRNLISQDAAEQPAISYSKAVRAAAPAVVNIYTRSIKYDVQSFQQRMIQNQSLGSGVIMSAEGYILTNYHVVSGADQIVVALQDGRQLDAVLIGQDSVTDLAVLFVEAKNLPVIPQQADIEPQVGDLVLAIGNPLNLGQSITQGIVSGTGRAGLGSNSYSDLMQMDAAINQGNSGGALVNSNGVLVGINTAAFQRQRNIEVQGIFFAVPYKLAHTVMLKLIKHGKVVRGYLGMRGLPVINAAGERQISTGQQFYGVLVEVVEPFGPADQSGLQQGDIILAINKTPLNSVNQALDIVAEAEPDTVLELSIERKGQKMTINCKLGVFQESQN